MALPSLEDEQALRQTNVEGEALVKELSALGVEEVVVKNGQHGSQVYSEQRCERVAAAGAQLAAHMVQHPGAIAPPEEGDTLMALTFAPNPIALNKRLPPTKTDEVCFDSPSRGE
ncbi:MAG: hypothetical protein ACR2PJ_05695 [Pseudomonadales bacterium]